MNIFKYVTLHQLGDITTPTNCPKSVFYRGYIIERLEAILCYMYCFCWLFCTKAYWAHGKNIFSRNNANISRYNGIFRVITRIFRVITRIFREITRMFRVITRIFRVITRIFRVITRTFRVITRIFDIMRVAIDCYCSLSSWEIVSSELYLKGRKVKYVYIHMVTVTI